ncbi:MAG: hypothetical protein GF364_13110 [Candidatus Lokiarchaeota archaeon]|nr:hypothetical protein [Candidatus Lokiarchaeota archaeon]
MNGRYNEYEALYQDITDLLSANPDFSKLGTSELALYIQTLANHTFSELKCQRLADYNKQLYLLNVKAERQKFISNDSPLQTTIKRLSPLKNKIETYIRDQTQIKDLASLDNPILDEYRAYSQLFKRLTDTHTKKKSKEVNLEIQHKL